MLEIVFQRLKNSKFLGKMLSRSYCLILHNPRGTVGCILHDIKTEFKGNNEHR